MLRSRATRRDLFVWRREVDDLGGRLIASGGRTILYIVSDGAYMTKNKIIVLDDEPADSQMARRYRLLARWDDEALARVCQRFS